MIVTQLHALFNDNALYEPFQSRFCPWHSTNTALLRVFNDFFQSADSGSRNIFLPFDLSAAFGTVNYDILISCLSSIVITDIAL